ncbi:hypothetical protein DVH24_030169 [Malus domestica]|uniref:Uncharacterized protein n=1 Tax=Malus domestica TaxID=3750 RepID=A0A498HV29_MALDO|nr:hypothetical protein DVH24_030169 [Malus domestica]
MKSRDNGDLRFHCANFLIKVRVRKRLHFILDTTKASSNFEKYVYMERKRARDKKWLVQFQSKCIDESQEEKSWFGCCFI